MKKILSLCINLLLFIISDAVPLKLIAGDRSVVKKDGATHTISKYYVVPNDFNTNNVTNSMETSKSTVRLYSKSMDADTASEHQVSETRAEAAYNQTYKNDASVNNNEVNVLRSDLSVVQADDNTAESTETVNTEQNLGPDDLGNLQVEPIANYFTNVNTSGTNEVNLYNSSESLQNGTLITVENTTQTFKKDVEDKLKDLILTMFLAVQESSAQNLENFWKLVNVNIDRISDDDELSTIIQKIYLLLNIYTNLYEAAQSQKPVASMIDSIIDILQIPFTKGKKSNTNESQYQTDVRGDYDEECFRKCVQKRFNPQFDSNGTYFSETESQEGSNNLELKNLDLQRRQRSHSDDGDDWVNTSNDPGSNQVAVTNQPSNILRSQLLVPNNINVGVPDGFNVRLSIPKPTLNHVTRENDVQEDPKSNQNNPDSADIDENLDDQPLPIKTRVTDNVMSWTIEDKSTENLDHQPLTIESKLADNIIPWHNEAKTNDNLPWHIEDKTLNHQPWIIEHRTTNTLPWTIVDRETKKLPWHIENIMGHSPKTLYQSRYPSVITTHGSKILLHPNQPMTGTVHSVKHGVKKPYHIYTYVINPETSLYEIPTSGNIFKVKSKQPNASLETRLYGMSTSHGGNKIEYANQPSPSYYESQISISKPSVDISSQTINTQLKHTNSITSTYDTSNEVNPSGYGREIQKHPGLISTATSSSAYTNIPHDYDEPSPVYGGETHKNPGLISKASSSSAYTNLPDKYDEIVYGGQRHQHPPLITSSAASSSVYTNLPDEYDEPLYGEQTHQHPDLISSPASSSSGYTNLPDEYDKPVYVVQTHQHPGLISSSASSNSEYTNVVDDYDKPSAVYGGQSHKYPGFISKASADSEYTNLANDYNNPIPDYGQHTDRHPGLITKISHYPEYANVVHGYDEPIPVYDKETDKHSGWISTASSSSAYTNLPNDYDEPSPVYGGVTHKHPGLISTASSSSAYTNLPNDYDEPSPGYDGETHNHPGLISTASSSSVYTNLPNDYDEPSPVYGGETHKHPGWISTASSSSAYTNLPDEYDEPSPVYGGETHKNPGLISKASSSSAYTNEPVYGGNIQKNPGFISKASSHSEYTNLPNEYDNPTSDYEEDTDRYPDYIQTPFHEPTKTEDNLLVYYHPYGHKVNIVQPSLIAHLHGNQAIGLNYLKDFNLKLAPTYRLFTLDNLLKLYDAIIKTIKANGDKPDIYDNQELMNLRKIIDIILTLAEHLEEREGSIEWYEKIFYNTQRENRHPLEIYVYNLIRQRWLHELISVLYTNNFNFNILQNPRIFSFLGSWQFPNYVLNFMEIEELLRHKFDAPELFDQTFSSQYSIQDKFATYTYDDVLEEVPENLENYVTNNVIESYKTPHAGIVLSIAGVEAEPDANAIIYILQKYLHYKSVIEKQQNVIIRDNKVQMLKHIILFLREKGYDASTIADLIHKLYTAVDSTEGKGSQIHHTNFAKNMYDVILPVLRRSGR